MQAQIKIINSYLNDRDCTLEFVIKIYMERKYKYLGYLMFLFLPLVFLAFYTTYFKNFPNFNAAIQWFDHVHAIIAGSWLLLLIIQPILINRGKTELHRKLGRFSYFLFPLLIISFIPEEIKIVNRGTVKDLFFPVGDTLVLVPLYLLAIYHKKEMAKHMRYMIASSFVFFGPTIGRIGGIWMGWSGLTTQNVQYAIIYSLLAGLILMDIKDLKKSKPYFVAMVLFLLHQITFYILFL